MISIRDNIRSYIAPKLPTRIFRLLRGSNGDCALHFTSSYDFLPESSSIGADVKADLRPSMLLLHPELAVRTNFSYSPNSDVYDFVDKVRSSSDDVIFNNKEE